MGEIKSTTFGGGGGGGATGFGGGGGGATGAGGGTMREIGGRMDFVARGWSSLRFGRVFGFSSINETVSTTGFGGGGAGVAAEAAAAACAAARERAAGVVAVGVGCAVFAPTRGDLAAPVLLAADSDSGAGLAVFRALVEVLRAAVLLLVVLVGMSFWKLSHGSVKPR